MPADNVAEEPDKEPDTGGTGGEVVTPKKQQKARTQDGAGSPSSSWDSRLLKLEANIAWKQDLDELVASVDSDLGCIAAIVVEYVGSIRKAERNDEASEYLQLLAVVDEYFDLLQQWKDNQEGFRAQKEVLSKDGKQRFVGFDLLEGYTCLRADTSIDDCETADQFKGAKTKRARRKQAVSTLCQEARKAVNLLKAALNKKKAKQVKAAEKHTHEVSKRQKDMAKLEAQQRAKKAKTAEPLMELMPPIMTASFAAEMPTLSWENEDGELTFESFQEKLKANNIDDMTPHVVKMKATVEPYFRSGRLQNELSAFKAEFINSPLHTDQGRARQSIHGLPAATSAATLFKQLLPFKHDLDPWAKEVGRELLGSKLAKLVDDTALYLWGMAKCRNYMAPSGMVSHRFASLQRARRRHGASRCEPLLSWRSFSLATRTRTSQRWTISVSC